MTPIKADEVPQRNDRESPYQAIIDIIDILLRKIAITPPNELTRNLVKIHISETSLPQSIVGIEELNQILSTLHQAGAIGQVFDREGDVWPEVEILSQGTKDVDLYGATFFISEPNKELLLKEREKWSTENNQKEQQKIPTQKELEGRSGEGKIKTITVIEMN